MTRFALIKNTAELISRSPIGFLIRISYSASLLFAKVWITGIVGGSEIWARNSYQSKLFQPGSSDIDLTIFSSSAKKLKCAIKRWSLLRRLNPLFHEVNAYSQDSFSHLIHFANFFELSRDPLFIQRTDHTPTRSNIEAQAIVFILRQLKSDYSNLTENEGKRIKKWNQIFSRINSECPQIKITTELAIKERVQNTLTKWLELNEPLDISRWMEHCDSELAYNSYFQALYPQLWAEVAIHSFPLTPLNIPQVAPTEKLQLILIYQIYWEVWGIYGQLFQTKTSQAMINHLKYMTNIIDRTATIEPLESLKNKARDGIKILISLISELHQAV